MNFAIRRDTILEGEKKDYDAWVTSRQSQNKDKGMQVESNTFSAAYKAVKVLVMESSVLRNAKDDHPKYNRMDFDQAWSNPEGRSLIKEQANKETSGENTDFLEAVEKFEDLVAPDFAAALEIYKNFVADSAKTPINIDEDKKKPLDDKFGRFAP